MKLPVTARTDVSEGELTLRKLDRRDMAWRTVGLLLFGSMIVLNILALLRINQIGTENSKASLQAQEQLTVAAHKNYERLNIMLCIVSAPVTTRSPQQVDACYPNGDSAAYLKAAK